MITHMKPIPEGASLTHGMGPADMESAAFQQYLQALLAQSPS